MQRTDDYDAAARVEAVHERQQRADDAVVDLVLLAAAHLQPHVAPDVKHDFSKPHCLQVAAGTDKARHTARQTCNRQYGEGFREATECCLAL
jgi:hypothetical protein